MQASVGGIYLNRGGRERGAEPLGVVIYCLTMGRCPHCGFSRSVQPQVLHHRWTRGCGGRVGNMGVLADSSTASSQ